MAGPIEGRHGGPLLGVAVKQAEDGPSEVAEAVAQARTLHCVVSPRHRRLARVALEHLRMLFLYSSAR